MFFPTYALIYLLKLPKAIRQTESQYKKKKAQKKLINHEKILQFMHV